MIRAQTSNIPSGILDLCASERYMRHLQVLTAMKATYGAYTAALDFNAVAGTCGISARTVRRSVAWLLNRNWIGKDAGTHYLRSWDVIRRLERLPMRGAWAIPLKHIKNFERVARGALVANVVRWQSRHREQCWRGYQRGTLSVRYLARVLKCGVSTAHARIQDALETGAVIPLPTESRSLSALMAFSARYVDAKDIALDGGRCLEFREIRAPGRYAVILTHKMRDKLL